MERYGVNIRKKKVEGVPEGALDKGVLIKTRYPPRAKRLTDIPCHSGQHPGFVPPIIGGVRDHIRSHS